MKTTILSILFLTATSILFGQYRVALHHAGTASIFSGSTPFVDAYSASVDGDTIYLPGAQLSVPGLIDKRLTIFGAGIDPDSTAATGRTILSSSINVGLNADKLWLEGVVILGDISFAADQKIDSVVIKRNYFNSVSIDGTNSSNYSNGVRILENYVLGTISVQHCSNVKINNNAMHFLHNLHSNAWVANNVFFCPGSGSMLINATETLFENNTFEWCWGFSNVINCTFIKNAFVNDPTTDLSNTWLSNYINVPFAGFFVNYQSPSNIAAADYHLTNPSGYLGTTGNQIGIYGGITPMKEGDVPANPHFVTKSVASQTNAQGELNISITVGAQDH